MLVAITSEAPLHVVALPTHAPCGDRAFGQANGAGMNVICVAVRTFRERGHDFRTGTIVWGWDDTPGCGREFALCVTHGSRNCPCGEPR